MINISDKPVQIRTATATGTITLSSESISQILNNSNPKGDVLENAKLAAINAVKKTPEIVFMCHPLKITQTKVLFNIEKNFVTATVKVTVIDKTGCEIESVMGVQAALLAIFDLSKRYEKDSSGQYPNTLITDIKVTKKTKVDVSD